MSPLSGETVAVPAVWMSSVSPKYFSGFPDRVLIWTRSPPAGIRIALPSVVHEGLPAGGALLSQRTLRPDEDMTYTPHPALCGRKAICLPSGDHTGWLSREPDVSLCR